MQALKISLEATEQVAGRVDIFKSDGNGHPLGISRTSAAAKPKVSEHSAATGGAK
jgi:hypothetical protein